MNHTLALRYKQGQIILLALVLAGIFAMVGTALVGFVNSYGRAERATVAAAQALAIAEGALENAIGKLNQNPSYIGETSTSLGGGTFTITISNVDSDTKRITATGYVPDDTNPFATKAVQATVNIDSSTVSFNYGVQIGYGGLEMANGACIEGNVYSNGTINAAGGAYATGDVWVAGGTALAADQQQTTNNRDLIFGKISPTVDFAQGFQLSADNVLNKISLYIKKVGTPGNATVRILTDNAGVPSKTSIGSGTLTASSVTTNYSWVDVSFATPPSLSTGLTYWLSIDASANASNYWVIGSDTGQSYTAGFPMTSANYNANPPVWTATSSDANFKTWTGGINTKITDQLHVWGDAHAHRIEDSEVDGDAYYQQIDDTTVHGTRYPDSTDPGPKDFPISDGQIQVWKDEASVGDPIIGDYHVGSSQTLGPVEITGNLTFSNNLAITIGGTIWVHGNITTGGGQFSMTAAPSYGAGTAVIITDGKLTTGNGNKFYGSGTPHSYIMMVSTSLDDFALSLSNGSGDYDNSDNVVFYAPYGSARLYNGAFLKEVSAFKVYISNGACVRYEGGLADVNFSSGPGGSWTFVPGSYAITR